MSKRTHFDRIAAAARAVWPPFTHRLLLLTGQSNAGFPFDQTPAPNRPASLLEASFQNARQYLWARSDPAYGRAVAEALQPILASASRGILLVTGSCGLQILEAAWPHLRRTPGLRIEILALGPVGSPPHFGEAGFSAVQGSGDLWSRMLYRGPVAHQTSCGHMDYWHDAVTRDVVRSLAERLLTEAS